MKVVQIGIEDINRDLLSLIRLHLFNQSTEDLHETLKKALKNDHVKLFVLYDQDKPIGFCYGNLSIGLESKGYYYWINEFFMIPTYRNQGYGHTLMSYVKEKLKDENIHYVALVTSSLNEQAKAFFKKEGFHEQDYLWFDYITS